MSELVNTSEIITPAVPAKNGKINLLDLNRQQMREFFKEMGEKPFRADQVLRATRQAVGADDAPVH